MSKSKLSIKLSIKFFLKAQSCPPLHPLMFHDPIFNFPILCPVPRLLIACVALLWGVAFLSVYVDLGTEPEIVLQGSEDSWAVAGAQ